MNLIICTQTQKITTTPTFSVDQAGQTAPARFELRRASVLRSARPPGVVSTLEGRTAKVLK